MQTIDNAIEWIYGLHVGVVGQGHSRHEKPHKPVLLLAVLDLIATGQATPDRILWSQALRQRFTDYFEIVRTQLDQNTPENPFRRLRTDGCLKAVEIVDGRITPLIRDPLVGDFARGTISAALTGGLKRFVLTPAVSPSVITL